MLFTSTVQSPYSRCFFTTRQEQSRNKRMKGHPTVQTMKKYQFKLNNNNNKFNHTLGKITQF